MATFGPVGSFQPNVMYDPAKVDQQVQGYQRNALAMDHARQDQGAQMFEKDATARIGLARQFAEAPDDVLASEWGPSVQRLQAAGFGHGLDPTKPPPRDRLRMIASSDITGFQRLQIEEKRRATEANLAIITGGVPGSASSGSGAGAAPGTGGAVPATGGRPFQAANLPQGVDPQTDQLVRTVLGEAGGEDDRGQQAVAHVVLNRARQSGQTTEGVIFAPNQFEPWGNPQTRARLESIDPNSPQYQRALEQVRRVQAGEAPDPTGGATHFYSPRAQAGLGRQAPSWDNGQGTDLGRHRFFNLGFGAGSGTPGAPPGQQQAAAPAGAGSGPGGGVAARTGGTDMAGPGAPAGPQVGPNGFTEQQTRELAAANLANPSSVAGLASQMRRENAALTEQARDNARRDQQRQQDLTYRDAAEGRASEREARMAASQAEQARLAAEDRARRTRLDEEKAKRDADPSLNATEAERKAAGFYERMQGTERILQRIVAPRDQQGEGYNPGNSYDRYIGGLPVVGNWLTSEPGQRYMNAAAEWTAAKLRFESGAAIGIDEARREAETYFAVPGDSPAKIEQKRILRETAMISMRRNAGRSLPQTAPEPGSTPPPATGGSLLDGATPPPAPGSGGGTRPPLSSFGR